MWPDGCVVAWKRGMFEKKDTLYIEYDGMKDRYGPLNASHFEFG